MHYVFQDMLIQKIEKCLITFFDKTGVQLGQLTIKG